MQEKTIADVLRGAREQAGFSRAALGRRCGVSRICIYSIEHGEFVPSPALCSLLARHLGLDSDEVWLLAGHVPRDVLSLLQEQPRAGCDLVRRELSKSRAS